MNLGNCRKIRISGNRLGEISITVIGKTGKDRLLDMAYIIEAIFNQDCLRIYQIKSKLMKLPRISILLRKPHQ